MFILNSKPKVLFILTIIAVLKLSACAEATTPAPTQSPPSEVAVVTPAALEPT